MTDIHPHDHRGFSPSARRSASVARKIKNRLGQAAYEDYKRTGVVPFIPDPPRPSRATRPHIPSHSNPLPELTVGPKETPPAPQSDPKVKALFDEVGRNGIHVDLKGLDNRLNELLYQRAADQLMLDDLMGFEKLKSVQPSYFTKKDDHFNPRSKKHINAWIVNSGEDETHSVSDENLRKRLPPDIAKAIQHSKYLQKVESGLQILRRHTDADVRVRVEWTEAATGRWYTGQPPLQTLPKETRDYLRPDDGNVFYAIDWLSQELRILAKLSGEKPLQDVFNRNGDPHLLAYEKVTGNKPNETNPTEKEAARGLGKMLNYALIFGIPAKNLGQRLDVPTEDAQNMIDAYFRGFPAIAAWRDKQRGEALKGFVKTLDGRKIPIPDEIHPEMDDYERSRALEKAQRKAVNYLTQGSAADQLVQAMKNLKEAGHLGLVRAVIHDAVLIETPSGPEGRKLAQQIELIMSKPFHESPAPAEIKGPSLTWGQVMDGILAADDVPADSLP